MAVKDKSASALARLRNQSIQDRVNYQICLQLFVQEEFLRRLSRSAYNDKMILKGGMFIYTLTSFKSRPTRDIDFLVKSLSNEPEIIRTIMQEICNIPTENDFISIEVIGTERITLEKKYPGVKTKLLGKINNVRIPFSIDIGIDDVIVPEPVKRKITTRLEGFEMPEIYTYSLESTIAEKVDAILLRMETTSRMKDFYDIYYLSGIFNFDGDVLRQAIMETMNHREHILESDIFDRIRNFPKNQFLLTQWMAFPPAKEMNLSIEDMIERIKKFIFPVLHSIQDDKSFAEYWSCAGLNWIVPESNILE